MTSTTEFRKKHYSGANGVSIVGDIGGDPAAPSVLLLHGGGQTRHSWGVASRELVKRGYHVVNLDARGHGESGWSADGHYSVELFAQDLEAVIRTLPTRPALVGASMGGATSLYLVGTRQAPVASALIMVDIVPRVGPVGASKIQGFMRGNPNGFATLEEAADAVAAYNPHRPRPSNISGLMKNLRRRDDGRLHWHWDPRFLQNPQPSEPPQFGDRLSKAADNVRIPTLLVRGLQSDIVTDEGVDDLRRHLPQLEVFEVGGAGHMVAGDKNDAFNVGVFEFLGRNLPLTGAIPASAR